MHMTEENARLFRKEFKAMCEFRQNYLRTIRKFALENLPLPKNMHDIDISNQKPEYAEIRGITEKYFDCLNGVRVHVYSDKTKMARPRVQSDGTVMRDTAGNVVLTTIEVPKGSLVVSTDKKVVIPNLIEDTQGVKKKYKPANSGFMYITMTNHKQADGNVTRQYYYAIPKEYLYNLNYCCLVVSVKPRQAHACYSSLRVLLQNGCYVYLSVMPLNKISRRVDEQRIVYQALSCDMEKQIRYLCDFWAQMPVVKYPNGYKLTYAFPRLETTIDCNGESICLSETMVSNAMTELDAALYSPVETLSLKEQDVAIATESQMYN